MIHYHGGPITPDTCAIRVWRGRHAFISFAASGQMNLAAEHAQSFALDNGAFSFWKAKKPINWQAYYEWVRSWRNHPGFDFAVVPDVIEGTEQANDELAEQWPFPRYQGAVVWHVNESIERLVRLANTWPRVCIGSSGDFDVSSPRKFLAHAKRAIGEICDEKGQPICKLHGLRMLNPEIFTKLPLSSGDSTTVGRNIGLDSRWKGTYQPKSKETRSQILVERIEAFNGACRLYPEPRQDEIAELLS